MSITKTKNNTYRLRLYIPDEVKPILGITSKMYEKTFKTRREAKQTELEMLSKVLRFCFSFSEVRFSSISVLSLEKIGVSYSQISRYEEVRIILRL